MALSLGLGLDLTKRGDLFSPASLFAASEAGFWGEVTTATLWQDTARTSPVTAAGQSVASWGLRTSSGMIYAEQATAGNRPLYQVDANGRGYLEFDGATNNRMLQTAAVNFSATDEVTVIAGVRKLSDAAGGIVVELTNGATGRFNITAPSGPATNFGFLSSGTTSANPTNSGFASPVSAVVTGLGDISADSAILRVNGAQVGTSANDQGTGNFANAAIYIGRRGGGTLPFNGQIYALIARGLLTSGAQLTAAESWANARTGAY